MAYAGRVGLIILNVVHLGRECTEGSSLAMEAFEKRVTCPSEMHGICTWVIIMDVI